MIINVYHEGRSIKDVIDTVKVAIRKVQEQNFYNLVERTTINSEDGLVQTIKNIREKTLWPLQEELRDIVYDGGYGGGYKYIFKSPSMGDKQYDFVFVLVYTPSLDYVTVNVSGEYDNYLEDTVKRKFKYTRG